MLDLLLAVALTTSSSGRPAVASASPTPLVVTASAALVVTASPIDAHDPEADPIPETMIYIADPDHPGHMVFVGAMNGRCEILVAAPFDKATARMFITARFNPDLWCAARDRARYILKNGRPP